MSTLAASTRRRGDTPATDPTREREARVAPASRSGLPRYLAAPATSELPAQATPALESTPPDVVTVDTPEVSELDAIPAPAESSALFPSPGAAFASGVAQDIEPTRPASAPGDATAGQPAKEKKSDGGRDGGPEEEAEDKASGPARSPESAQKTADEEAEARESDVAEETESAEDDAATPEADGAQGAGESQDTVAPADAKAPEAPPSPPSPPELGGIMPRVIPLPPVMSRDQRLDILARTGMRPEAHHAAVRQRLDAIATRARQQQEDIVRAAREAAAGAVAAFTAKADAVPSMTASAEETIRGAYAGARGKVRSAASTALKALEAHQADSRGRLDTSSMTMEQQLERVLASGSPAIKQLHQEQMAEVDRALGKTAAQFNTRLGPHEKAIREARAQSVSDTATGADAQSANLPPEVPWAEMLPARMEAERNAWPTRAKEKAADVHASIEQNAAMVLAQRESFAVAILQLVNPAAVQLEKVTQHEEGQVCSARDETRLRVATDYERAVNAVTQFRDRAITQLNAGEQGAVKEVRAIGTRLEADIRLRSANLEAGIGETAREMAEAYRTQMAGVNDSIDVSVFLDVRQTEPLLAGAEQRFAEMYAQQSTSLASTIEDATAATHAAIDAQTRSANEVADNSTAEAWKIAGDQIGAIADATDAFGRAVKAPTDSVTSTASPYTATATERLGARPEQVRSAVAQMLAKMRETLDGILNKEDARLKAQVTNLAASMCRSLVADGLAKISDLNDRVRRAYKAMAGLGTDESGLFDALRNITVIQGVAMEAIWRNRIPSRHSLRWWLDDELSGDEYEAALAYINGDTARGARFELEASMHWYGDDEAQIEAVLRDLQKEPPPGGHIKALQNTPGWKETNARLQRNLDGSDLDVTNALLAGNRHRADALRLRERIEAARRRGDHDKVHKLLEEVPVEELAAVRREFAAAERGLGPAVSPNISDAEAKDTFVAFITRDRQVIDFRGVHAQPQLKTESITGANRDLAVALASRTLNARGEEDIESRVAVRATRMDVEVHRKGDRHLENLQKGFEYEQSAEINDDLNSRNPEVRKRAEQRRNEAREVRTLALRRFAGKHGGLTNATDEQVREYTAGVVGNLFSSEEGRTFGTSMVRDGFADPAAAMRLAVEGRGTDEDLIKRTLGRLDRDQIATLRQTYRDRYHEDLDQRLGTNQPRPDPKATAVAFAVSPLLGLAISTQPGGELSGDDRLEVELLLRGRPRNDRERYELELARTEQQRTETGFAGKAAMEGTIDEALLNEGNRRMIDIVDRAGGLEKAFDEDGRFVGANATRDEHGVLQPNQEEAWAFGEELKWNQFGAEAYQAGIDRMANFLSTALAILAAVVVSIALPGVGGAIAGALIGGLLSMTTKAVLKGGRYGWEEAAVDLAVTAVDALTAGLTHGLGQALRGAGKVAQAGTAVARAGKLARIAAYGRKGAAYVASEGLENFIGSVPSSFTGQVLNEQNWKGGSPFENILKGTLIEAGISTGAGVAMGGGMELASGAVGAIRGTLRERAIRNALTASIPHDLRPHFADVPILELPKQQFDQLTGSRSGQAVTVLTPDGPVIYMREGASPRVLREEGIHLLQTREAEWRRHVADLSEANLARWHEMSLGEQLSLYRSKVDVEIDAQQRLLLDLGDELAVAGPIQRVGLRRRVRDAEITLDNLRQRRIEIERITPERMGRIADGVEGPPAYLDQPPRLFAKKGKSGAKADVVEAQTHQSPLPADKGHPDYSPLSGRTDVHGTVVEIGPRWVEPNGREYRLVGVVDDAGRLTQVRQEIRSAHEGERWVQRGSESAKQGQIAEDASRLMSVGDVRKGWDTRAIASQWDASGRGFDEVLLDFRMEGNELVARLRVIEVKDYPGRYVPLDSFTAILPPPRGSLDDNLKFIGERLRERGTLPPPAGLGLTADQVKAARRALVVRRIDLEIRVTPETHIGARDTGSVITSLEDAWSKFGIPLANPPVRTVDRVHLDAARKARVSPETDVTPVARTARERQKLRERALRNELERSVPPALRTTVKDVPIVELPPAEFHARTGSDSGQAVTLIGPNGPEVLVRQGADPRVLREEGIHVLQSRERAWADRVASLSEGNLARWHEMSLQEQLALYRTKIEVEIDAHRRLLADLGTELQVAKGAELTSVMTQMANAQTALANLTQRLEEVVALTPTRIRRMRARGERPPYLDKPPRLFSKKSPPDPIGTGRAPESDGRPAERPGAALDALLKKQRNIEGQLALSETRAREAEASGLDERARRIHDARPRLATLARDVAGEIDAELDRLLPQLADALHLDLPELIQAIREAEKGGRRLDAQQVIDSLRNRIRKGTPPHFGHLEGAISADVLEQNVIALGYLRDEIAALKPDAVLAVERGGAFLAEALRSGHADFPPTHIVPKDVRIGESGQVETRRTPKLEERIRELIGKNQSTFVIVDYYMGGIFATELTQMLADIVRQYSHVRFEVRWMREATGFERLVPLNLPKEALEDALREVESIAFIGRHAAVDNRFLVHPASDGVMLPTLKGNAPELERVRHADWPVDMVLGDDMGMAFDPKANGPLLIFDRQGRIIQVIPVPSTDPITGESLDTVRKVLIRLLHGVQFPPGPVPR